MMTSRMFLGRPSTLRALASTGSMRAGTNALIVRSAASTSTSTPDDIKNLRPISPHLTIYQPQLTWFMSGFHRITGVGLSGLFYLTGIYSVFGNGSTELVQAAASLPAPIFYLGKLAIVTPFTYHSWNGIRHLLWDSGYMLSLQGVYQSGYAVLGATALSSIALLLC